MNAITMQRDLHSRALMGAEERNASLIVQAVQDWIRFEAQVVLTKVELSRLVELVQTSRIEDEDQKRVI
eukprot:1883538-Heterocapsa_arctica.AAC.1